ncbi:ricin-type beta-trefoil lectin domain protein [Streptomyces sp. CG1]|uniref:RICIN domain-containing protein n=1 Tax=Streptomyces sp. CG1 TaxID=1287523 RepID=UPI0034E2FF8A
MEKSKLVRIFVAAAVPAIGLAVASPATAEGYVHWKNKVSGTCLAYESEGYAGLESCDSNRTLWYDSRLADSNWVELAVNVGSRCLDSNARGTVYFGGCVPGNMNQRWSEEKWEGGWVLKNVATGRCLSETADGDVQTFYCSSSNDSQFWS